jgi:hypothetical protein
MYKQRRKVMKMKFVKDAELTVVESCLNDIIEDCQERFSKDEIIDADVFGEYDNRFDIQFGDGSVIMGLEKNLIEIIED